MASSLRASPSGGPEAVGWTINDWISIAAPASRALLLFRSHADDQYFLLPGPSDATPEQGLVSIPLARSSAVTAYTHSATIAQSRAPERQSASLHLLRPANLLVDSDKIQLGLLVPIDTFAQHSIQLPRDRSSSAVGKCSRISSALHVGA